MTPIVIPETLIKSFKYWHEGIQVGMTYRNELYVQLKRYDSEKRLDAYEEGFKLCRGAAQVCITVTDAGYTLWQNLRSLSLNEGGQPSSGGLSSPVTVPAEPALSVPSVGASEKGFNKAGWSAGKGHSSRFPEKRKSDHIGLVTYPQSVMPGYC